ncbi:T9SS type A sorting domain-containing protein [Salibacteraceae bacterium]|nr:T9SS type A sorting domain-containing protein [Salibacteraceae bacterium]
MTKIITLLAVSLFIQLGLKAQPAPIGIELESISIPNLGGVQAYSFGQQNGKWLIVGGRLDGLHRRQPFAAFDVAGHNNQLIVIDPVAKQKWTASLSSLPTAIQEQLSSTNMNFFQDGDYLYCVGGYGYSATLNDHTTFANITAIKVSDVIDAVVNGTSFTNHFRQLTDSKLQITGGKLKKINDTYYLLGGQKFLGRYNPMGPTHGPGFIQEYTDEIRKFTISDDGTTLSINHLPAHTDAANLHRRDYNAEAQIMPNGTEGITMFSGVFQPNVDLPFLNCVNIDTAGYQVNNAFQQYYNHYHCASIPLYSAANNEMHTLFFGGIAQYYDSSGVLVQDNDVPFVKTIARVTRDANGKMTEYKLPVEMPSLLGAGSEFIVNESLPAFPNDVLKLDDINEERVLLGYIYGGISSTAANIFFTNTGSQSSASSEIFAVYLTNYLESVDQVNAQSAGSLDLRVYPNPSNKDFTVDFKLTQTDNVRVLITDISGRLIEDVVLKHQPAGKNTYYKKVRSFDKSGVYFITIESSTEKAVQKIIVE